jgi:hypothetical protein
MLGALRVIGIYHLSASGDENKAIGLLRALILDAIEDQCTEIIEGIDLNRLSPLVLSWLFVFLPSVGLERNILYGRVEGRLLALYPPLRFPFALAAARRRSPAAYRVLRIPAVQFEHAHRPQDRAPTPIASAFPVGGAHEN